MKLNIKELNSLAHERPAEAIDAALELIYEVALEEIPKVWAACGTAYRRQERFGEALKVLKAAEAHSTDRLFLGDVKQRLAYLEAAQGNFRTAVSIVVSAQNLFLLEGDMSAVGRTLVDQGMFSFHLGQLADAESCLTQALRHLNQAEARHRFSALVGLANCFEVSDPELAKNFLRKSESLNVHPPFSLKRDWVAARIAARKDPSERSPFIHLMQLFCDHGQLLDASLVALDALRYSQAGSCKIFQEAVRSLAFALPENGVAAAAVTDIWIRCLRGKICEEVVLQTENAVKHERAMLARCEI